MAKSLAWGYGIAGAVVAAAVIVVVGSTVGLTEGADEGAPPPVSAESATLPVENVVSSEVVTTASGEQVEYVYVDEPATRGDHDDDDDDHDDDHDDDRDHDDDDDDEHEEHEDDD